MGASLVAQALQSWSHVSDRAHRVLVAMALTAKDNASRDVDAGLYFGGHDGLVYVLDFKDGIKHDSKLRAVRDAVDELEQRGAIVCTKKAESGSRAVYKLTLGAIPMPRKPKTRKPRTFDARAETVHPPAGGDGASASVGDGGSASGGDGASGPGGDGASATYKEPLEEPLEELLEEPGVGVSTNLTVPRKHAPPQSTHSPPSNCSEPTCQLGYRHDPTRPRGKRNLPCPTCRPHAKGKRK